MIRNSEMINTFALSDIGSFSLFTSISNCAFNHFMYCPPREKQKNFVSRAIVYIMSEGDMSIGLINMNNNADFAHNLS